MIEDHLRWILQMFEGDNCSKILDVDGWSIGLKWPIVIHETIVDDHHNATRMMMRQTIDDDDDGEGGDDDDVDDRHNDHCPRYWMSFE